ncbi:olfactory receptor 5AS1-like isoform X1 [Rhinatrema bivittatum]|uniref:olfactory receptor 5AS1-like isoform X1 n=1 Tax=Rhinatrema bivittatum TaxID=194408 RepID=UPI001128F326|nr:olfactory receptor 5AS1-like isoform X1 [Rhinatrema bivittatum]
MSKRNGTAPSEFILQGFTNIPELQMVLFTLFLIVYLVTMVGNLGIIAVIRVDPRLQNPMYFFLSNLAFLDICYSTVITPKMLINFLSKDKSIFYASCVIQMYFFTALATTECLLLAAMAYDRYVAICNPLHYMSSMTRKLCISLVVAAYIGGFLQSVVHTTATFQLSFCGSNEIKHFFCDIPPLLMLSCTDIRMNMILLFSFCGFNEGSSALVILVSYIYIISTILKIRSTAGRCKAFSTCASHLVAVTLFYGTLFFMYLRPATSYSLGRDRFISVFYTVAIPMLNPMIYSLRNKEVKEALRKAISRSIGTSS